jgi:hypothetical protein
LQDPINYLLDRLLSVLLDGAFDVGELFLCRVVDCGLGTTGLGRVLFDVIVDRMMDDIGIFGSGGT